MRLYVSSIGGDIAQSIVGIISQSFKSTYIVGTDLTQENSGKGIIDFFDLAPSADNKNYTSWLSEFLKKHSIEYFIPVNEKELHALASVSEYELSQILGACSLIWAGRDSVTKFEDKSSTSKFLDEIGIPIPKYFLNLNDVKSDDFPVVVKPNIGSGSRNFFVCRSRPELEAALLFVSNPIVQKYVGDSENEFTAAIFRNVNGVSKVINFRRKLVGGATGWAQVHLNSEIERVCEQIAAAINLCGSINVQFRLDKGQPTVFEINGRFSSTVYMRHLLGFEDLLWSLGQDKSFSKFDHTSINGIEVLKMHFFEVWPKK